MNTLRGIRGWFVMACLFIASLFSAWLFSGNQGLLACGSKEDWLIDGSRYVATIRWDSAQRVLHLENELVRRSIHMKDGPTTISLENLITHEQWLRAVGPEARLTIDGTEISLGGLLGQPVLNYFKPEWLETLKPIASPYQLAPSEKPWQEGAILPRFAWKPRPEWMATHPDWPPRGKHVWFILESEDRNLPQVEIHYEIYDGLPLISKWIEVVNRLDHPITIDRFVSEELRCTEVESTVEGVPNYERYPIWVESDYAFAAMDPWNAQQAVHWEVDPGYETQVNYQRLTACLLKCYPTIGPSRQVPAGDRFSSFRVWELLHDSSDRERRGLAQRRMYRTLAPWIHENPLMFHKIHSDEASIRDAIQQCVDTGFEMIIMSFGSGINLESQDPEYRARYRRLVEEAHTKGIALGGYTLTGSRGAGSPSENTQGIPAKFGVMPCLGAKWGRDYLDSIRSFMQDVGLDVLENDGPYPGDLCDTDKHAHHHSKWDSQWVQWEAEANLFRWCREKGIFVNQPDWYFLVGGSKTGMGYRETNWSLPRAEQQIIERQNIYDGTWTKTSSMGWMFVPLSQYHGGGAAATIEPLDEHREHYDARLANLLGSGTQACYRGPRLYDTPATLSMLRRWVEFYKRHRAILSGDLIHLRRADGRDWDGWLMVNPHGEEKGLLMIFNPTSQPLEKSLDIPLYYTGLKGTASLVDRDGQRQTVTLSPGGDCRLQLTIPANGYLTYIVR